MPSSEGSGCRHERLQGICQVSGSFLGYDYSASRGSSRNLETYRWATRPVPEGLSPRVFSGCSLEWELTLSYKIQLSCLIAESSFEDSS
jgi:hypothetical protein